VHEGRGAPQYFRKVRAGIRHSARRKRRGDRKRGTSSTRITKWTTWILNGRGRSAEYDFLSIESRKRSGAEFIGGPRDICQLTKKYEGPAEKPSRRKNGKVRVL